MNKQAEKNKKISEALAKTRAKRLNQECKVFDLKIIKNKLNLKQKEALKRVFLEAKWLKNDIIASPNINKYDTKTKSVLVKKPNDVSEYRELRIIAAQVKQTVLTQVKTNLKTLSTQKQNGRKVGSLRFVKQVNSIDLKQYGVSYKFKSATKVKIQGIPGYVKVRGSEQLQGYELANAKLINKPSGYHLQITAFKNKSETQQTYQSETKIGLDMGVKTHITLSNGEKFNVLIGETGRLKRLQRKLSKQVKGSNNYHKTRGLINKQYEIMDNKKNDAANKLVHTLLSENETVYMQDESITAWRRKNGYVKAGRKLHHSILGRVKAKLVQHERVVVLPKWYPTTQLCRGEGCGSLNKHSLDERVYKCSCGYSYDRDTHAAMNMISLGTDFKNSRFSGMETVTPVEGHKASSTAGLELKECHRNRGDSKKQEADKLLLEEIFPTEAAKSLA